MLNKATLRNQGEVLTVITHQQGWLHGCVTCAIAQSPTPEGPALGLVLNCAVLTFLISFEHEIMQIIILHQSLKIRLLIWTITQFHNPSFLADSSLPDKNSLPQVRAESKSSQSYPKQQQEDRLPSLQLFLGPKLSS